LLLFACRFIFCGSSRFISIHLWVLLEHRGVYLQWHADARNTMASYAASRAWTASRFGAGPR
jgi:hypothetical protein